MEIIVKKLSDKEIQQLDIKNWPVWEKEASIFNWNYSVSENCYLIEGEVEVETSNGEKVRFQKGDFVSFPKGLKCKWNVIKAVRKHYNLR